MGKEFQVGDRVVPSKSVLADPYLGLDYQGAKGKILELLHDSPGVSAGALVQWNDEDSPVEEPFCHLSDPQEPEPEDVPVDTDDFNSDHDSHLDIDFDDDLEDDDLEDDDEEDE